MDKELLEIVFDNVYNGIYIVDGQGMTLAVNRTFEEMSGIRSQELVGRSLYDLVGKDNYFTGSASLLVMERKTPATATYSTSTGRKLLVKGRPIFGARGEIRYIVNTIWDLTVVQYQHPIDDDTARDHLVAEEDLIACSAAMRQVIDIALRVAPSDSTLLITGETGVGKSMLARLIHRASNRRERPLMQINCAAIPEALLESELFGYEAGAFTGADRKGKPGLFEQANGGTVFLDEIAEIPLHTQAKLLGVLQDREYYRIGGRKVTSIDVRLIAATNRDLARLVAEGRFRADLFYRLEVVPLQIPPLRDRRDDIPALIDFFLAKHNRRHNTYRVLSRRTMEHLTSLSWPGNIRELKNAVERLVVTAANAPDGTELVAQDTRVNSEEWSLKAQLQEYECRVLLQARRRYGSTRRVAAALGISQASAVRKLQRLARNEGSNIV
jgi:PAS domain S-box-containing protein